MASSVLQKGIFSHVIKIATLFSTICYCMGDNLFGYKKGLQGLVIKCIIGVG